MKEPRFHRMLDYDRARLPNAYLARLEQNASTIDEATEATGYTIGYPGWGVIYHLLLSHLHPERFNVVVETGTNQGCTTIVLAQALRDSRRGGHVFTIELEQDNYAKAIDNLELAGVRDLVTALRGDTRKLLPEVVRTVEQVDVAFLDASHLFDDVLFEFEAVLPKLSPQSLVIFDNTWAIADEGEDPRVNGALREIQARHGGNLVNLEYVSWFTPGMAIWQQRPFAD